MVDIRFDMFKKEDEKLEQERNNDVSIKPTVQKSKQEDNLQAFNAIRQQLTEVVRMLRTLEDRYNNMMKKVQLTDQNMIEEHKKLNSELRLVDSDLTDAKKELNELDYKFGMIIKELDLCAKRKDVDLIRKYIELWQPTLFIRREDADKLIDQILKEKIRKKEKVL